MINIGEQAPNFTLATADGGKFTLNDFLGKKNVLLMFFPLAFTPV